MGIPDRFDQRLPPELEGFGPAFYRDLLDLVRCYGTDVRGIEGLRRMHLPTPVPCQVSATAPPSKMGNVSVRPVPFDGDLSRLCVLVLDDGVASYVQWDRRITAAQLKAAMAQVDAEMAHCRDAFGRRQRVPTDRYAPPELSVDKVFGRQKVLLVGKADGEVLRQQFDRPDDLVVVPDADGKGNPGLCRKRDLARASREDEVTERVMAKYGVRDQSDIDGMSRPRLQQMMAEIAAELEKE